MQIPLIEYQFNTTWPSPGGTPVTTNAPPFGIYSISKQIQPFLILILALSFTLLKRFIYG